MTVVGDDAQSIYSFRAANVGNILEFPQRFDPPACRITLEHNYRSVQPVLDAANSLIAEGRRQYPKTLRVGPRRRRAAAAGHGARRSCAGRLRGGGSPRAARGRRRAQEAGGAVSQQPPQRHAGSRTGPPQHPLRQVRRPEVPGGAAHQGRARGAALGRQRAATALPLSGCCSCWMASGRQPRRRCLEHLGAHAGSFDALAAFEPPAAAAACLARVHPADARRWRALLAPWAGQLEQVVRWYQPLLAAAPRRRDWFARRTWRCWWRWRRSSPTASAS